MSYVSTPCQEKWRSSSSQSIEGSLADSQCLTPSLSRIAPGLDSLEDSTHRAAAWLAAQWHHAQAASSERQPVNRFHRWCRQQVLRRLSARAAEPIQIQDADGLHASDVESRELRSAPLIEVLNPQAYSMFVTGGSLGGAEAYLRGHWRSPDLLRVMRALSRQSDALTKLESGTPRSRRYARVIGNWFRRNTRSGSRRNISAHYDLSNEFFQLMLDPTMTYSSGIFQNAADTMEQASQQKYDRICRKLALRSSDHLLEIGCGWGGFAIHAATHYGCQVTAVTISQQQFNFAKRRIQELGLEDRIELLLRDYRDLTGQYDKLVSIEMIEAVGEKYLDTYFQQCCSLLRPDGLMMLQSILIADDRFDHYRKSVDFIRRYVFPGGFLPAMSAISQSLRRATDFRIAACDDFGLHYAETLARWRTNFWNHIDGVRKLGFDERFIRTWDYYLCYCEAGFAERQIGVSHLLLMKPGCRDTSIGLPLPG